ncbi:MAG: uL15 family ribosomal protein [Clostridia bacterium]|nr:uL15 family ribosomal protein [Clostridia bacterium]
MLAGIRRNQRNRAIVNLETLSAHFESHEPVTIHSLKEKKLIPAKTDHVKILGKGTLDKLLHVEAHDFSDEAIKMILMSGGNAIQKA